MANNTYTSPLPEQWFIARPLGALFFGQPRPKVAGETHRANSQFPPPVRAWQGLLRTHFLRAIRPPLDLNDHSRPAREKRKDLVGSAWQLPRGWQIWNSLPACLDKSDPYRPRWMPWTPVPRFLLKGSNGQACYARPVADHHGGLPEKPLLGRPELGARAADGNAQWCSAATLKKLLSGEDESHIDLKADCCPRPPFVHEETQPGLALDNRNGRSANSLNGMLYFLHQLRLDREGGFLGGFSGTLPAGTDRDAIDSAQGAWGHKGRPVMIETTREIADDWLELLRGDHLTGAAEYADDETRFWLVTLTPVAVEDPADPKPRLEEFPDLHFACEGVLSGRPVTIGGLDMANGSPLENRPMLPAGTAWLFRLEGDASQRRAALLALNNSFRLGHRQEAAFGYGHTLVGLVASAEHDTVHI